MKKSPLFVLGRRTFVHGMTFGAAAYLVPGVFAEELALTARQTEGPFYPDRLPLDTDNDLIILNDALTPAVGKVTHLTGRVLRSSGTPVRNATVEIWQADAHGVYLHSRSRGHGDRDANFQGFGRFLTDAKGRYYFRTIKPVPYQPRAPHIHFAVNLNGHRMLTTQCYIKGAPLNAKDGPLNSIQDRAARERLIVDFQPIPDSKTGELAAHFDIVIGHTPEDQRHDAGRRLPPRRRQPG